jgi:hypothetical protein
MSLMRANTRERSPSPSIFAKMGPTKFSVKIPRCRAPALRRPWLRPMLSHGLAGASLRPRKEASRPLDQRIAGRQPVASPRSLGRCGGACQRKSHFSRETFAGFPSRPFCKQECGGRHLCRRLFRPRRPRYAVAPIGWLEGGSEGRGGTWPARRRKQPWRGDNRTSRTLCWVFLPATHARSVPGGFARPRHPACG